MKTNKKNTVSTSRGKEAHPCLASGKAVLRADVGNSIDLLVDYLLENDVQGIHPLIMGEIEKRLIIKALQRTRGNKLQAARLLGIGRNTFYKKVQALGDSGYRISEKFKI
jgi:DNA-binding protein Fis